jgi:hypothetical protein
MAVHSSFAPYKAMHTNNAGCGYAYSKVHNSFSYPIVKCHL